MFQKEDYMNYFNQLLIEEQKVKNKTQALIDSVEDQELRSLLLKVLQNSKRHAVLIKEMMDCF